MRILLISCSVIVTCCLNVVVLEYLIKLDYTIANTMTFCQFTFLCLVLYVTYGKMGTKIPEVPVKEHAKMIVFFFLTNVINNYAFHFQIDLPLHMIFRSGSLIANMLLGILILKKSYPLSKYLSIIMVTMGISLATMASAEMVGHTSQTFNQSTSGSQTNPDYYTWSFGIVLLTFALVLSACLGVVQEQFSAKFGKHPDEATYFSHLIPLPGFLFLGPEIVKKFINISQSTNVIDIFGLFSIPKMFFLLFLNSLTFFACIRCVFKLTSEAPSLTVTLVVSIRKFLSLLFSIFYFQNTFSSQHWFATLLVFTGTFLFTGIHTDIINWLRGKEKYVISDKKEVNSTSLSSPNQNNEDYFPAMDSSTNTDLNKYLRKQISTFKDDFN